MAILSSDVSAGTTALASQYNNLRTDLLTGDVTIAGIKTFSSAPVLSEGLKIATTKLLYLDGGGDTYIKENDANQIYVVCGDTLVCQMHNTYFNPAVNVIIETTKKLYLDGGDDTYIREASANYCEWYAGGSVAAWVSATQGLGAPLGFSTYPTKKIYLDDSGNTFIVESSGDVMDFYTGGTIAMRLDASQKATFYGDVNINYVGATPKGLILTHSYDAGYAWTIIPETSGTSLQLYYNATLRYYFNKNGTAYADQAWSTFSPDIKKDNDFKDKEKINGNDFLKWALKDAKKPLKPYQGIRGTKEEEEIYGKDICKISIGVAHWAEEAEARISELERRLPA